MNDRLKQFADQCRGNPDFAFEPRFDKEKFAELIIRDVVKTVKRTQNTSADFEWVILNNYDLEINE